MLINGEWVDSTDGRVIEVINPATEEIFAQVPMATKEDVNKAIKAADAAFPAWAKLSPAQRGGYLRKAGELVLKRYKEIGSLMTEEQGKPVEEAQGEVKKAAEILQYYAEEGERVYGRIIANAEPDTE